MNTGRGVWFKLPQSDTILHGGNVLIDDGKDSEEFEMHDHYCSLNETINRKVIFVGL